jgi:hypothetical protein
VESLSIEGFTSHNTAMVLIGSKPKALTSLRLQLQGDCDSVALALLQCPNLTHLWLECRDVISEILPIVKVLPQLSSLTFLALEQYKRTDLSLVCLLSFLSHSSVRELMLGNLSPFQEQLLVNALPSLPSLLSLDFETHGFTLCEHESANLALFSALSLSPLRRLMLCWGSFRRAIFETCLDKIPNTQLTDLFFGNTLIFADGFEPTKHGKNYKQAQVSIAIPKVKDRFCLINIHHYVLE